MSRVTIEDEYTFDYHWMFQLQRSEIIRLTMSPFSGELSSLKMRLLLPGLENFHYLIFLLIDDYVISIRLCVLPLYFPILYRNAELYLTALRSIDRKSEQIESQPTPSQLGMKN